MDNSKIAVIAGAGPAGLTAALELLEKTDICPVVIEGDKQVGGLSKTVVYKNNRIDIGGHRFFSKNDDVVLWWKKILPQDLLTRNRSSRIFYLRRFFDYPVSLKWRNFANLGFWRTVRSCGGYIFATIFKRREKSLEDFYINRFGKPLYRMFFEDYTNKVWGIHPSKLSPEWGGQRVRGLSILTIVKNMLKLDRKNTETSLIEKFIYPKYGPGQLWESVADKIVLNGGNILLNTEVVGVSVSNNIVTDVTVKDINGNTRKIACDYFFSSMPIKDLVASLNGMNIPFEVAEVAKNLPYRDFITVGLLVNKKNYIPDTWIYIQERDVKIGRLQIFNNWSPFMVADNEKTMWIGLEYFCNEDDSLWKMSKEKFIEMAINEVVKLGFVEKRSVLDAIQIRVKKAYPVYCGAYYKLNVVRSLLDTIENMFLIGRNGQHRYNNADHSMLTAVAAVNNIIKGIANKDNVWNVNCEKEYHERK